MRPAVVFKTGVGMSPLLLAVAALASAPPAYAQDAYLAAGVCVLLMGTSFLLRSDWISLVSFGVGSALLTLSLAPSGPVPAVAAAVALLIAFDIVWLTRSLSGIVETRIDPEDREGVARYFGLLKLQAWRSSVVGVLALALSLISVGAPLPVVTFANPVAGSGILALAALLLALLAGAERDSIRRLLRQGRSGPGPP